LIRKMAPEKAIIISTHLLEEVTAVCTRALIISKGRIVADGTPEELAAFVAFLLGPEARFFCGSVIFVDGGTDALMRADDHPTPMGRRERTTA